MIWDETNWVEKRYAKLKKELLLAKLCKFFAWVVGGLLMLLPAIAGYKLYTAFTTTHIIFAAIIGILEIVLFKSLISMYIVTNKYITFLKGEIQDYKELLDEWKNRKMD